MQLKLTFCSLSQCKKKFEYYQDLDGKISKGIPQVAAVK
jgi:hypothetical protein